MSIINQWQAINAEQLETVSTVCINRKNITINHVVKAIEMRTDGVYKGIDGVRIYLNGTHNMLWKFGEKLNLK